MINDHRRGFFKKTLVSVLSAVTFKSIAADNAIESNSNENDTFIVSDNVNINGSLDDVFTFLTDTNNADIISTNLTDVNILNNESSYNRILMIHGFENHQHVRTQIIKNKHVYLTLTELFGVKIHHHYQLSSGDDNTVLISIVKKATFTTWFDALMKPFIKHQLTRPEHDGLHLSTIKKAFETSAIKKVES